MNFGWTNLTFGQSQRRSYYKCR